MRYHGTSQLPAAAAPGGGATTVHGGGGDGAAGYMVGAMGAGPRFGLGGLKPEAALGGGGVSVASLAQLGRSRPLDGGAVGSTGRPVDCICRQHSPSWDEVVCTGCQKAFHATCYGETMKQRNRNYPPLCFLCLSLRQNPFFKVRAWIGPWVAT